jgi:hypothetical protein
MSWWLAIGLAYLVLCWIGWIVIFHRSCADECECQDQLSVAHARHGNGVYWLSMALTLIVMGPFLPLVIAHAYWNQWLAHRAWRKFGRTHREVVLEPIHPANTPQEAQDHIERCAPVLLRLEFAPLGIYLLKPEPFPIYSQCLLSREGETVVDVSLIDGMASVSFVSVLANGHVIETGCCAAALSDEDIESINGSGRFTAHMIEPEDDEEFLARAYRSHLETLAELEQRYSCAVLHVPPDQVLAVKRYENAVFGDVMFSQGKKDNRPEPAPCPTGIAKPVSPALCPAAV